ncbi:MAG: polyprenol monophosphomannose synthase [Planctomycetes bacterium]|nr:polyprenol monophosphomannose synthase [Planctomycetota bacterium]
MAEDPRLTVVLPTYNERDNLARMVEALLALPLPARLSILVVDDNSPDATGQLADELAARHPGRVAVLHRVVKEGLGKAYLAGFARALSEGAELVLQMDCDFSHPPRFIPALLAGLPGADMVLGSRFAPGGSVDPNWAWYRKLLSWFANSVYVRVILGSTLRDMTGGFRLWRAATLRGMDIQRRIAANGYVFQVEMAYVAQRLGYAVREVPIEFPDRTAGESKMSLGIQLEAARRTWEVRRRHRGLTPGDRAG